MASKALIAIAGIAVVIVAVAVVGFALQPAQHAQRTNNATNYTVQGQNSNPTSTIAYQPQQSSTTVSQQAQNLSSSGTVKLYVGNATYFQNFGGATVKLVGISTSNGQDVAAISISSGGYSTGDMAFGQNQFYGFNPSSGPYLLVYQIGSNWADVAASASLPNGFTQVQQANGNQQSGSNGYAPANLGACGQSNAYFSATPLSSGNYINVVPMGWVSPGGHVLPSDHIYFQITAPGAAVPNVTVTSPGNMTVYQIDAKSYSTGQNDYSMYFAQCDNVTFFMHHIESLAPVIASNLTPSESHGCTNSTANGVSLKVCTYSVSIKLHTGERIGTIGGFSGAAEALDFGASDYREAPLAYVNQSRYSSDMLHIACPIGYFTQSAQSIMYSKLGLGGTTRTTQPLCGSIMYDVVGTAQGNWFPPNESGVYMNEGVVMSLAHDNLVTGEEMFSTGDQVNITGMSGVTWYFTPMGSGMVNTDFANVSANGQIHCYDSLSSSYNNTYPVQGTVLLQLMDANALRIQYQSSATCGSGPWSMSSGSTAFYR
ncbi:MAG: hypothetical protein KGH60_05180 [Candidatus Micrarchaeota archaeon]|nr:hypothetical protein [Candidatus Micrarchaeota archaeon]